jgi:hypothetical protein
MAASHKYKYPLFLPDPPHLLISSSPHLFNSTSLQLYISHCCFQASIPHWWFLIVAGKLQSLIVAPKLQGEA